MASHVLLRELLFIIQYLLSVLPSELIDVFFSGLLKFKFIFPKLLETCEWRSVRDSSERAYLGFFVIKSC